MAKSRTSISFVRNVCWKFEEQPCDGFSIHPRSLNWPVALHRATLFFPLKHTVCCQILSRCLPFEEIVMYLMFNRMNFSFRFTILLFFAPKSYVKFGCAHGTRAETLLYRFSTWLTLGSFTAKASEQKSMAERNPVKFSPSRQKRERKKKRRSRNG